MIPDLNYPFDESTNSPIAYDYSPNARHATVIDGTFVPGRNGNCIYFPGEGRAELATQVFNLTGTFSTHFWAKADIINNHPSSTWVLFRFNGVERYLRLEFSASLQSWTHLMLVKFDRKYFTYRNGRVVDFQEAPSDWGHPTGFEIRNDTSEAYTGHVSIDDFYLFNNQVLSPADLGDILTLGSTTVNYEINGRNFNEFGVVVKPGSPKGIIGLTPVKSTTAHEWEEYHGEAPSADNPRYTPRVIEMECWFKAMGQDDFIENAMAFKDLFYGSGLKQLIISTETKPLVYMVQAKDGIDFEVEKWRSDRMFTHFTLKLTESEPVKRVLRYVKSGSTTPAVSITVNADRYLNIYWGDKTETFDVYGDPTITVTHAYQFPGTYYIVITGVIEEIKSFTTNAVIVWQRFS